MRTLGVFGLAFVAVCLLQMSTGLTGAVALSDSEASILCGLGDGPCTTPATGCPACVPGTGGCIDPVFGACWCSVGGSNGCTGATHPSCFYYNGCTGACTCGAIDGYHSFFNCTTFCTNDGGACSCDC